MFVPSLLTALVLVTPQEANEAPEALHLPDNGTEVELLDYGGRPMVELHVDAHPPLRVLVDTGSTLGLSLSRAACEQLGLEPIGEVDLGGPEPSLRYLAPEVRLGDAVFEDLPITELGFVGGMPGLDGVMGFPAFESCLLTFDFAEKRFRLHSGAVLEGPNAIPFHQDATLGFGLTVNVDVAGTSVEAHVDTGSGDVAMFSNVAREGMPLAGEPQLLGRARTPMGDADIHTAKLEGDLKLGPITVTSPDLRFSSLPQIAGRPMGNLGAGFFRDTRVTIDQKTSRMLIETARARTASSATTSRVRQAGGEGAGERRRLGVQLRGMREQGSDDTQYAVGLVMPGSEAERAGLQVDDVLLEVDGEAMTQESLGVALGGKDPIALKVKRGEETVTVTLFAKDGD